MKTKEKKPNLPACSVCGGANLNLLEPFCPGCKHRLYDQGLRASELRAIIKSERNKKTLANKSGKSASGKDVSGYKEKTELSPIEKIKLIEEIRNRNGVNSYDEAISIANKDKYTYKSYNSFKKARREYKDYLK